MAMIRLSYCTTYLPAAFRGKFLKFSNFLEKTPSDYTMWVVFRPVFLRTCRCFSSYQRIGTGLFGKSTATFASCVSAKLAHIDGVCQIIGIIARAKRGFSGKSVKNATPRQNAVPRLKKIVAACVT
jgi:hypothetical protein